MIKISICLSDLPTEKITTAGNGKKYVDLIVTDTMQNVRSTILQKQKQFEYMQKQMSRATNRSIVEVKSSVSEKKELKTNKITLPVWITTFQKEQQYTEAIA